MTEEQVPETFPEEEAVPNDPPAAPAGNPISEPSTPVPPPSGANALPEEDTEETLRAKFEEASSKRE